MSEINSEDNGKSDESVGSAPDADQGQQDAELQELRAQIATLQQDLDRERDRAATQTTQVINKPPREPGALGRGGRTVASFVLILIAAVLAPLAVATTFAVSQISDTDRYVSTVAPLADDQAVQDAVADNITEAVFSYIDLDEIAETAVTAIGDSADLTAEKQQLLLTLSGPLKTGLQSFTNDQIVKIVESEVFANAWVEANRVAHVQIVKLLSGDNSGSLQTEDGVISIDIGSVVEKVKQALIADGFELAEKIPAVNAEYVIYESDNLGTLQTYYSVANTVGYWLPFLAIAIALIGIFVANRRRIAVMGLGLGVLVSMAILSLSLSAARTQYLLALPSDASRAANEAFFDTVSRYLYDGLRATAVAGLILFFAALLTGPSRFATVLRGWAISVAGMASVGLEKLGLPMSDKIQPSFSRFATAARVVAVVVAILAALLPEYSTVSGVLWSTAGLLVALFIIEIFTVPQPATSESGPEQVDTQPQAREESVDTPATG